jgi:hypothetical protein
LRAAYPLDGLPLAQPVAVWSGNWTTTVTCFEVHVPEEDAEAACADGGTQSAAATNSAASRVRFKVFSVP